MKGKEESNSTQERGEENRISNNRQKGGKRFYNNENQFPNSRFCCAKFTLKRENSRIRWISRKEE